MTNTTVYRQHKYGQRADGVLESGTAYSRRFDCIGHLCQLFSVDSCQKRVGSHDCIADSGVQLIGVTCFFKFSTDQLLVFS